MRMGVFNKPTAYLGVATGIAASSPGSARLVIASLGMFAILTSVLTLIWLLFAGYALLS